MFRCGTIVSELFLSSLHLMLVVSGVASLQTLIALQVEKGTVGSKMLETKGLRALVPNEGKLAFVRQLGVRVRP